MPITYVTNGVHPQTWIAGALQALYRHRFGDGWRGLIGDASAWSAAVGSIPDAEIWSVHQQLKQLLIAFIRQKTRARVTGPKDTINEHSDTRQLFSPDVLTHRFCPTCGGV